MRARLEHLDLTDTQAVEEATRIVEALAASVSATLPHHELMAHEAKRRPERRHYDLRSDT